MTADHDRDPREHEPRPAPPAPPPPAPGHGDRWEDTADFPGLGMKGEDPFDPRTTDDDPPG